MTLVPAFGRDYKSKAQIQTDFEAGKDFRIMDNFHPSDGKLINREQLIDLGVRKVSVRYAGLRKITPIAVK